AEPVEHLGGARLRRVDHQGELLAGLELVGRPGKQRRRVEGFRRVRRGSAAPSAGATCADSADGSCRGAYFQRERRAARSRGCGWWSLATMRTGRRRTATSRRAKARWRPPDGLQAL